MDVNSVLSTMDCAISSMDAAIYSFWLSGIVLLLIYIVKYKLIRCNALGADLLAALLEFPIDVLIIQIPIMILSSHKSEGILFGILILIVTFIVITISYSLRRKAICVFISDKCRSPVFWLCCLCEFVLSAFVIFMNYSLIRNIWIGH